MRNQIGVPALTGLMTLAMPAIAQTGATAVSSVPGKVGMANTVEATAAITAINAATREITLKGPQGNELIVEAGPEVKNFAQLKVGDQVRLQYLEALTLELKKGSTAVVSRTDDVGGAAAKPGERPGAVVGSRTTIVAEVMALDAAKQMVTLRGPQRTVDLKVNDPAQFKLLAKGDRVEAVYTQAVAIAVEPVKK